MRCKPMLLFACLILAKAAPAGAQSSLAVNGMLDVGVFRGFDGIAHVGTIQRSNLALSGSEDLGGGLRAVFRLSTRFDLDTGASEGAGAKPFWHDEATVGLQGAWGTLRVGRAMTPMWTHDYKFDPWANFNRIASPAWYQWHYLTPSDPFGNRGTAEYGRVNNGIFYDSPTIGGATLRLSASPERQPELGATGRHYSALLEYQRGPLLSMAAFERNSIGDKDTFVAGRYTLGVFAVMAAWDHSRTFDDSLASRAATLGATWRIGPNTLKAGYGRQRLGAGVNRFASLGADHALSRRTILYLSVGHKRDEGQDGHTSAGVGLTHLF